MTSSFDVDGRARQSTSPASTPLLWVLREEFGERSVRFGCGEGACGACTVVVDGRAAQACDLPLWAVEGKRIETAAGLERDAVGRALLDSFELEGAAQCGYCIGGVLMTAWALLRAEPRPSRERIAEALDRNLCRCGTHVRILRAIENAARALSPATDGIEAPRK